MRAVPLLSLTWFIVLFLPTRIQSALILASRLSGWCRRRRLTGDQLLERFSQRIGRFLAASHEEAGHLALAVDDDGLRDCRNGVLGRDHSVAVEGHRNGELVA